MSAGETVRVGFDDAFASSVNVELAKQSGDPTVRRWALEHAIKVDDERGDNTHAFGKHVLHQVLANAFEEYKAHPYTKRDLVIPSPASSRNWADSKDIYSAESALTFRAVVDAFGLDRSKLSYYDLSALPRGGGFLMLYYKYPGMEYVHVASDVIATPRYGTQ